MNLHCIFLNLHKLISINLSVPAAYHKTSQEACYLYLVGSLKSYTLIFFFCITDSVIEKNESVSEKKTNKKNPLVQPCIHSSSYGTVSL